MIGKFIKLMIKNIKRVLLPGLMILLMLSPAFPVLAQDGNELPESITTVPVESETVVTSTEDVTILETEEATLTLTETSTPDFTLAPTSTATFTPTPTLTPTATKSTVPTNTQVSCNMDEVYKSQIVINYSTSIIPQLSVDYSVVKSSTNADGSKISVLQVSATDFCSSLAELKKRSDVIYAEPNYEISLLDVIPNDGDVALQYYLDNIKAPQAWEYETGSSAVIVAVLDTGVDMAHIELASKLVEGYDYVDRDLIPQDMNGHGTHVAGIIGAVTNNGVGMAGLSWGARIMPLRVLDAYGNGSYANTADAIRYAVDNGAQVINMSIGGTKYSEVLENAINYAASNGVTLVAATGNSGVSTVLYPAAFGAVIAVGATDSADQKAWFSNTGGAIDVVAPGVSIFSLYPGNTYRYISGTSMATPMVAGFAALLWSLPEMRYSTQVENVIKATAKDLGSFGWDSFYGVGLIQVGPGILYAKSILPTITPTATSTAKSTHAISTSTPTPTSTYEPKYYITSTKFYVGSATVTPGEIFMQQTSPTSTVIENIESSPIANRDDEPSQTATPAKMEPGTSSNFIYLVIGVFYIFMGIGLFLYVRKRYYL
jgi:thermitase